MDTKLSKIKKDLSSMTQQQKQKHQNNDMLHTTRVGPETSKKEKKQTLRDPKQIPNDAINFILINTFHSLIR
jgi:hypothetical protein